MNNLAVSDINIKLQSGKITSLLGHNGAGKSTIVNIICGLLTPTKGSIKYKGQNTGFKQVIGYCGSELMSYPRFTLRDHLEFVAELKNIPDEEIKSLIETLAQ
jgi:ABC-type multidrug transport system ATPase subunit